MVLAFVALVAILALASAGRGSVSLPPATRADVRRAIELVISQRPGLLAAFVWAMADKESGFNPHANADTANEDSLGLFQVNWRAHGARLRARGAEREWLFDPTYNATYWGEIADQIRRAAIARGYRPPGLWHAIRLRLKGIDWDDFGSPLALETIRKFGPYLARYGG